MRLGKTGSRITGLSLPAFFLLAIAPALPAPASDRDAGPRPADINPVPEVKTDPGRLDVFRGEKTDASVYVIQIDDQKTTSFGMIDDWQAAFVRRKLAEAKAQKADLVVLEIVSFGGSVASCADITKAVQESGIPTVAFVNNRAISGGAFIAAGCDGIYMAPGSVIGDAMPVRIGPDGKPEVPADEELKEKFRSPVRAFFKSLGTTHSYPVPILIAMVDPKAGAVEAEVDGKREFMTEEEFESLSRQRPGDPAVKLKRVWCKKGQLLTLSADEAEECGLARGKASDLEGVCSALGISAPKITAAGMSWAENVNRYLSHPVVSLLLVALAVLGIVFELKSPGAGLGFLVALLAMGVFFWIQLVMDRAGAASIILFFAGVLLLAVEIFALPGFGVVGMTGFGLIALSILLSFLPPYVDAWSFLKGRGTPWWQAEALYRGLAYGFSSLMIAMLGAAFLIFYGAKLPGLSRLVQKGEVAAHVDAAPQREKISELVGRTGVADSTLRPAGRAIIDGRVVDVVSRGEYIQAGEKVRVVAAKDGVVTVDRVEDAREPAGPPA
ncbi:MAG: hypothetical protein N3A38_11705 [Planctomycetota bacterium]|nr:hypothetical protein [Planctomycetota bacterium]